MGLSVLVVDDAKAICTHVTRIVRNAFPKASVISAFNGKEAQSCLEKGHYDLIICDWEMPQMSGLELLQWTRQQEQYKTTPFLMATSRGERDYILKAIQSGVSDYLGKPFSAAQLEGKMQKLLFGKPAETTKTAAAKPQTQQKAGAKPKGLAQLRTSNQFFRCAIKDISLRDVLVVIKNEDSAFPGILEQVVVDIEQLSGDGVARINGFVSRIEAFDNRADTPFVSVKVTFVDDDPEKLEHISNYIASLR
ncbi:response regulator [Nitrincola alkalilacustris]|uniref:response regulator n=1 Tax=Nitrincola alkalilacustris TaxID=1571224 RepID=UPI00124F2FA9|nr:response regulator [Nitrincola alkalilacustris]